MKTFESVLILKPTLTKEEKQQTIKNILDFIYNNGQGKIKNVEEWGLKKLAYPIQKRPHVSLFYREGYYFDILFMSKDVNGLKTILENEENVIKYIISTKD